MIPTFQNLQKAKGLQFTRMALLKVPSGEEKKEVIIASIGKNGLELKPGGGKSDRGMFVFYVSFDATYGYADAGVNWACSGPYSGCKFQIGIHNKRVYAAHIARESGADASDKLQKKLPGAKVLFDYTTGTKDIDIKAVVAAGSVNASKYLFAWWAGDFAKISVAELTVAGMDKGKIISIQELEVK